MLQTINLEPKTDDEAVPRIYFETDEKHGTLRDPSDEILINCHYYGRKASNNMHISINGERVSAHDMVLSFKSTYQ